MPKREERLLAATEDAQRIREEAEGDVKIATWDLDPLKQFVRRNAWLNIIRQYTDRQHRDGVNRPLKFLTLPGPNASDIGLLWRERVLQQNDQGQLNVAICDRENAAKVAANLGNFGGPLAYSNRLLHVELADPNGVFNQHFPFDVVNLDMCQCLIPVRSVTGLFTLRWIFRLQRGQSFLLLLTTKPDPAAQARLIANITQNLANEPTFRAAYEERFGNNDPTECLRDYTVFTQIVFPKVVARMARDYGYRSRERFACRYQRNDEGATYDMICHSFEFEQLGRKKASLKYSPRIPDAMPRELDDVFHNNLSVSVLTSAATTYGEFIRYLPTRIPVDVVQTVAGNAALEQRLTREAERLQQWWVRP